MPAASPTRVRGRRATRPSGDDREAAILRTLEDMLEQRPFAEISVDDLARGAGLSRPTFYFYFASKDAVLVRLFARAITASGAEQQQQTETGSEHPQRAWHDGIYAFFDSLRPHRAVVLAGLAAMTTNSELRDLWATFMTGWIDYTAGLITKRAGARRGARHDPGPRSRDGAQPDERACGVRHTGRPEADSAGERRPGSPRPHLDRQHLRRDEGFCGLGLIPASHIGLRLVRVALVWRHAGATPQCAPAGATVAKLALYCVLAGVLVAAMLFPLAGGAGIVVNHASDVAAQDSADLMTGEVPTVSTMVDAAGNPIAWIYAQRRWPVPTDRIADTMKLAIVSIEDKRFAEHNGVDVQGTLTGLIGYLRGDLDTRGGSTIEQQYVKNYNLLVNAQTDAERRAAIETTPARKLREIRMALALDKAISKPEILDPLPEPGLLRQRCIRGAGRRQDLLRCQCRRPQLAAGRAAGRNRAVDQRAEPLHQPRGCAGPPQPGARHDDRQPARPGPTQLRAAREQPLGILPQPNSAAAGLHRSR